MLGTGRIVDAIDQETLIDMDPNDFAKGYEGRDRLLRCGLQLNNLGQAALECDRTFQNPRRLLETTWGGSKSCQLDLVDVGCHDRTRLIHRFGQRERL